MKKDQKSAFKEFLKVFPKIDLPLTLTEESQIEFSRHNLPIREELTHDFIIAHDKSLDEFTEYVPCFRLKNTEKFHAIVFWKAALMNYEYVLVTFTDKGELISKRIIAGTKSMEGSLVRSVATIDEDWVVHVVGGVADNKDQKFEASNSQSFTFEILANGQIIMSD